mmetsp:Transcript_86928/g.278914  ORF Transcript_86928/g.278914 Transcript_86928/m.278914 type:complete len:423 (-) Transcript_86928:139-1407(-)
MAWMCFLRLFGTSCCERSSGRPALQPRTDQELAPAHRGRKLQQGQASDVKGSASAAPAEGDDISDGASVSAHPQLGETTPCSSTCSSTTVADGKSEPQTDSDQCGTFRSPKHGTPDTSPTDSTSRSSRCHGSASMSAMEAVPSGTSSEVSAFQLRSPPANSDRMTGRSDPATVAETKPEMSSFRDAPLPTAGLIVAEKLAPQLHGNRHCAASDGLFNATFVPIFRTAVAAEPWTFEVTGLPRGRVRGLRRHIAKESNKRAAQIELLRAVIGKPFDFEILDDDAEATRASHVLFVGPVGNRSFDGDSAAPKFTFRLIQSVLRDMSISIRMPEIQMALMHARLTKTQLALSCVTKMIEHRILPIIERHGFTADVCGLDSFNRAAAQFGKQHLEILKLQEELNEAIGRPPMLYHMEIRPCTGRGT